MFHSALKSKAIELGAEFLKGDVKSLSDINAKTIVQSVFPDRKIITINGIDISMGGGNVHCITQQQPISI